MPRPNHNADGHAPVFDVEFAVTPDDKLDPVVEFVENDGLPHPSGKGLEKAATAVSDNGPGILYVCVPENSGLLDA